MERCRAYGAGVAAVGLVLVGVQIAHGLRGGLGAVVFLVGAAPFALVAATLCYAGYWIAGRPDLEPDLPRVTAWGVGGAVLFAAVAALVLFGQRVQLGTLERAGEVAADLVTVGAVAGLLVGVYDARSRRGRRALQRERDRVRRFADAAADVNNYGRALGECGTVREVSALCIQAVNALLGLSDAAVVRTGTSAGPLDSTVRPVPDAVLAILAEEAPAEVGAVRSVTDLPDAVPERADRALVATLSAGPPRLAVVALAEGPVEDQQVRLLELLLAHAATALAGIDPTDGTLPDAEGGNGYGGGAGTGRD